MRERDRLREQKSSEASGSEGDCVLPSSLMAWRPFMAVLPAFSLSRCAEVEVAGIPPRWDESPGDMKVHDFVVEVVTRHEKRSSDHRVAH